MLVEGSGDGGRQRARCEGFWRHGSGSGPGDSAAASRSLAQDAVEEGERDQQLRGGRGCGVEQSDAAAASSHHAQLQAGAHAHTQAAHSCGNAHMSMCPCTSRCQLRWAAADGAALLPLMSACTHGVLRQAAVAAPPHLSVTYVGVWRVLCGHGAHAGWACVEFSMLPHVQRVRQLMRSSLQAAAAPGPLPPGRRRSMVCQAAVQPEP